MGVRGGDPLARVRPPPVAARWGCCSRHGAAGVPQEKKNIDPYTVQPTLEPTPWPGAERLLVGLLMEVEQLVGLLLLKSAQLVGRAIIITAQWTGHVLPLCLCLL